MIFDLHDFIRKHYFITIDFKWDQTKVQLIIYRKVYTKFNLMYCEDKRRESFKIFVVTCWTFEIHIMKILFLSALISGRHTCHKFLWKFKQYFFFSLIMKDILELLNVKYLLSFLANALLESSPQMLNWIQIWAVAWPIIKTIVIFLVSLRLAV